MKNIPQKFNKTWIIYFSVILFVGLVTILGIYLINSRNVNKDVANTNNIALNNFPSDVEEKALNPIGIYDYEDVYDDNNQATSINHYYQAFGEDRSQIFQSSWSLDSYMDSTDNSIVFSKTVNDSYELYLGNIISGESKLISSLASTSGYSNNLNSLGLSHDHNKIYAVISYWEDDYNSMWENTNFSIEQILLNTELYEIDIETGENILLHEQQTNLETYSIIFITDKYILMREYNTELDRQDLSFFDIENNKFNKTIKSDFFINFSISPNGQFLSYQDLLSKAGDINPAETKILNLDSLEEINIDFISNYDFESLSPIGDLPNQYSWTGPIWGNDNKTLYFIKGGLMQTDAEGINIYKVDLQSEEVNLFMNIPSNYNNPQVLGIYDDNVYFTSISEDQNTNVFKFPERELLITRNGYPNLMIITETIKEQSIFTSNEYNFSFEYNSDFSYFEDPTLGDAIKSYTFKKINSNTSEEVNRDTPNGFNTSADDTMGLNIYENTNQLDSNNIEEFISWYEQDNISPSSGISGTPSVKKLGNNMVIEAIIADGIDSFGRGIFFINDNYIVVIESDDVPKDEMYEIGNSFLWANKINTSVDDNDVIKFQAGLINDQLIFPEAGLKLQLPNDLVEFSDEEIIAYNKTTIDDVYSEYNINRACKIVYKETNKSFSFWISFDEYDHLCGTERFGASITESEFQDYGDDFCSNLESADRFPFTQYLGCQVLDNVPEGFTGYSYYEFIQDYGVVDSGIIVKEIFLVSDNDPNKKIIIGYVPNEEYSIRISPDEFTDYVLRINNGEFDIFNPTNENMSIFNGILDSLEET